MTTHEPDLTVERTMAATPEQIWAAWTAPAAIALWWGPDGFTSDVRELDVRDGGRFDVVMRGPDGSEFTNRYVFDDVEPGRRAVYVHQGSPEHGLAPSRSVVAIEGGVGDPPRTLVTLRSYYSSAEDRRRHLEDFRAADGARQLLERLETVALRGSGH
ncbi:hypothetical protein GOARA_088_00310 [Gordonia araii NBRC 100433]|uniref:Activator of Hsp90 ATPase homologue 1/2-like C-terminal domain-containing protein n=1 Tax=Gordonia araii NBRC 100433 TaxID=1073574 RepID=G7H7E3_9ACTN|nr:SRPBCC domain-containing protein [Gordonia araii]GAB11768.1 hypothetical protein GOARA_088_00310 [Gordonia araii NBRC 100433]